MKDTQIIVGLSKADKELIVKAANSLSISVAGFARMNIMNAAKQIVQPQLVQDIQE